MSAFQLLAKEAHELLQNSEAYAAYAAKVARRYRRYDVVTKWVVATAACAPFIDKFRASSADGSSWFLALVPLVALALPLVNFAKVIQVSSELHGKYAEILPQLKKLWREVSASSEHAPGTIKLLESWQKELNDLDIRLATIRTKKSEMPEIKQLIAEAKRDCEKFAPPNFPDPPAKKEERKETKKVADSHSSYSSGPAVITYTTKSGL